MKSLLSDTDYTSGRDNRFSVAIALGKVAKIECTDKRANVRVIMADRLDHNNQPLISKPVPVLQFASKAKRSFMVPRLNDNVAMIKLPNGTSNYLVLGSFYTSKDPPPVTDPMLDYVIYDDGSTMQFNAKTGELTWKLKGNMLWDNEKDFTLKTKGNVDIEIDGNVTIKPKGSVDIEAGTDVTIKGATIKLDGFVHTTADMHTDGHHTDALGPHAGATREDLAARVSKLETLMAAMELRLAQLEARHGG